VALPRFVIRLIDPAEAYFDQQSPDRPRGPVHRGAVVFGPDVPGSSRPATDDELAAMRQDAARHRTGHDAAVADTWSRWAPELERAAAELRGNGTTQLRLGDRTIEARIVRFSRGDDVLHVVGTGPAQRGESLSRIRAQRRDPDVLLEYLIRAAARP
jgi:hypothetical protein